MERRPFGPTKALVPVIGQGTWHLEEDDREEAIAALRLGIDLGLTHIDTAEMYGDGVVEEIVGEAIAGRRDNVFVVSKVLPQHATRQGTLAACAASLARLGTDRLDGYLLHWPSVFAIAKASNPEHTAENAGAAELRLTDAELARIEQAFPLGRRPRTLPVL